MIDFQATRQYQRCEVIFDRVYPGFRKAGEHYQELLKELIRPSTSVLELGCGRASLATDAIQQADYSVGIDLSLDDLASNGTITYLVKAGGENIPVASHSVDIIISQWVFEHLENPRAVFREIARVLKPNGRVVIFTTNANNYIPVLSWLIPDAIRNTLLTKLLRRPLHETFPTFYRANTQQRIARYAQITGLRVEQTQYVGNPFYLAFSPLLFRLALLFEKITDYAPLHRFKLYLLVTLVSTKG